MTIETSATYKTDLLSRKLFGRMHTEIVALSAQIDNLLTVSNAMRLALGAATLTLAEVEALHVQQSHEKRNADATLYEAQSRLSEMLEAAKVKTTALGTVIAQQAPKVDGLFVQAKRIAERDIVDNEPSGPLSGLVYVDMEWFRHTLACSTTHVRFLIGNGAIPPHDAVDSADGASGRPKLLWLKHKALAAVQKVGSQKKGVAALV